MRVLSTKVDKLRQRQGQAIFNFLEWLKEEKDFRPARTPPRMADPFYIEDAKFDELWDEWLQWLLK